MNITIISVCSHPEHATMLVNSAKKHGWDLHLLVRDWKGFGTKLIGTYEYLKEHPEIDRFVFSDAFDVCVMGTPEEFEMKRFAHGFDRYAIIASAEKGLWPPAMEIFRGEYPTHSHGFNFINSGLYYADSAKFIEIFDACAPEYHTDDQEWLNTQWISGNRIQIDHEQVLFNSHSHISDGEYGYENGRIQILGNQSVFVHKNGRTLDPKLDELI